MLNEHQSRGRCLDGKYVRRGRTRHGVSLASSTSKWCTVMGVAQAGVVCFVTGVNLTDVVDNTGRLLFVELEVESISRISSEENGSFR